MIYATESVTFDGVNSPMGDFLRPEGFLGPQGWRALSRESSAAVELAIQEELAERLGASVKLKPRRGGKGSVIIEYSSLDELQGIVGKLRRA